jgi:hypothetical protein
LRYPHYFATYIDDTRIDINLPHAIPISDFFSRIKNNLREIFSLTFTFWEKTITKLNINIHHDVFPISIFIKLFPQFEKGSLIFGIQIAQISECNFRNSDEYIPDKNE